VTCFVAEIILWLNVKHIKLIAGFIVCCYKHIMSEVWDSL